MNDFADFLTALLAADVRFMIVGAHALQVFGIPRATGDLDVWVRPDAENAQRIMRALSDFGAPVQALGIRQADFSTPGIVAQLGLPPYRIDLLTTISGVEFDAAWDERTSGSVVGVAVPVIGQRSFVANKRASGRKQDLADVEHLEKSRRER